jgi:hypothetical protein
VHVFLTIPHAAPPSLMNVHDPQTKSIAALSGNSSQSESSLSRLTISIPEREVRGCARASEA